MKEHTDKKSAASRDRNKRKTKCRNCGHYFDDGVFCPRCGTRAKAKPDKQQSVWRRILDWFKERKTVFLILGCILIPPIPLTILIRRIDILDRYEAEVIVAIWVGYAALVIYTITSFH